MAQQPQASRIVSATQWIVGVVLLAFVLQSTLVGFRGGHVPIFGYHVRGTTGHGLLWLFIAGSFSFGIYVAITVVVEVLAGRTKGSGRQPMTEGG